MASPPRSEYRLRRRVQFYEVDSAGIVHFSNYFRYMEEAEHALWREAGLSIAWTGVPQVGFPRVATSFEFHRPLRFEDEFDIWIRVVEITQKAIRYTCVLKRDEVLIATGTLTIVCVMKQPDQSMKATAIPPDVATRFAVSAGTDS